MSSVTWKNNCVSGLMSHGSCAPMTFCGPAPGLVESRFLHESHMQWSSAEIDTEPCHARSPTKVYEQCSDYSTSGSSSRRQAPVESESVSDICDLVPDAKVGVKSEECGRVKSLVGLARDVARVQVQPTGKEEESETSDECGPLLVPNSVPVVSTACACWSTI